MDTGQDATLKVHSPSLVQPTINKVRMWAPCNLSTHTLARHDLQVLPAATCDKVATPTMAQFVSNDIDVLAIATDDSWCCKGINRVFHS